MNRQLIQLTSLQTLSFGVLALAGATLTFGGCAGDPQDPEDTVAEVQLAVEDGTTTPISRLPFIDSSGATELLAELLERPTRLGETTAVHVRLPPPRNQELARSLVRVVGEPTNPHVLFSSDALATLGVLRKSPGAGFFTAFATLPPEELEQLARNQDEIASGAFGESTDESVVFSGRHPVGRTINPKIDPGAFRTPGGLSPINRCFLRPKSTQKAWDQSLFITSPTVVLNDDRTWDPCTGAGTKGGVWTFAHLMREMAIGSGQTPENFVKNWLSMWLNNYTVNGDVVTARTQMFTQVIRTWAIASGQTAALVIDPITGIRSVTLSGPLDLDIAPFRLEAIVNRIDLGETSTGGGGHYGPVTGSPKTLGELRFIFGVVQPNPWGAGNDGTCGKKRFTVIFEYGVPGEGCLKAVKWAKAWTSLGAMPGFTAAYLAQLQGMTESVVLHGAAPAKGNQNAINQIRTNEIALATPWELREFTLSIENPATSSDTPANGGLRKHTVAQTPDDGAHSELGGDPAVNTVVNGIVTTGLVTPVLLPDKCDSAYTVPFFVGGGPFRGGNALVGPPGGVNFWKANAAPATVDGICARHVFSLNTCNGCHHNDSGTNGLGGSTNFVHIDPLSTIPVTLSKFLTGGGVGSTFGVNDTQFATPVPAPQWQFADLERRFQRLFEISHCTSCLQFFGPLPVLIERFQQIGPLPIDVDPQDFPELRVGPITDLALVSKMLDIRTSSVDQPSDVPADLFRPAQTLSH